MGKIVKPVMAAVIVVCGVVIVGSFFMPWARAVTTATKVASGIKEAAVTGPLKDASFMGRFVAELDQATKVVNELGDVQFKTVVAGYEIPVMANRKDSKTALSLIKMFNPEAEGLGKKVLLIYLVPVLALVCIALAAAGLKYPLPVFFIAAISGAISLGGFFKVLTAKIPSQFVQITLERGLWLTLWGYLFIFAASIVWIIFSRDRQRA